MDKLLNCSVCGIGFRGRSDALYCKSACRQKAHRGRTAERIAALVEPRHPKTGTRRRIDRPDIADTIQRAQREQRRARELCRDAAATQRQSLLSQRWLANRRLPPVVSDTTSPPWSGWSAVDRKAAGQS